MTMRNAVVVALLMMAMSACLLAVATTPPSAPAAAGGGGGGSSSGGAGGSSSPSAALRKSGLEVAPPSTQQQARAEDVVNNNSNSNDNNSAHAAPSECAEDSDDPACENASWSTGMSAITVPVTQLPPISASTSTTAPAPLGAPMATSLKPAASASTIVQAKKPLSAQVDSVDWLALVDTMSAEDKSTAKATCVAYCSLQNAAWSSLDCRGAPSERGLVGQHRSYSCPAWRALCLDQCKLCCDTLNPRAGDCTVFGDLNAEIRKDSPTCQGWGDPSTFLKRQLTSSTTKK